MSKQLADWNVPSDTDNEQPEVDRFEEEAAYALAAAARDLAARGWTPHELANLVAEAVTPDLPATSGMDTAEWAGQFPGGDPFA